jgi:hypothetical protein
MHTRFDDELASVVSHFSALPNWLKVLIAICLIAKALELSSQAATALLTLGQNIRRGFLWESTALSAVRPASFLGA